MFAFQKRPSRFEFDITKEQESSEIIPEIVEAVAEPEPIVDIEEIWNDDAFPTVNVVLEAEEKVAILEQIQEEVVAESIAEEVEATPEPVIEQKPVEQPIDLIHEAPQPEKVVMPEKTPPKTRIPFNVMMVNQDKQHAEKKKRARV